ncbi:MAG: gamma-glutamyl-gamma-aminobutyrate hydrolase family protein, partial [Propionibacteriaceae bacterium]|nr:gamma-glutamyl-gamma-aminobutyrate hydrolase family protein [Propionibacteriaceae bacterium]
NTGLTLRTIRIKDGVAQVRAGATLLYDSDPESEEAETALKASALLDAIRNPEGAAPAPARAPSSQPGRGRSVLLVDHRDSFVHTLANYLRQTGAEVTTLRAGFDAAAFDRLAPDLVVLSPGPGRPEDFGLSATVGEAIARGLPIFGVCLGLQGVVEHFGGTLGQLAEPVHGKRSEVVLEDSPLFEGLGRTIRVGRYHSLYAQAVPECLAVTARTADGVVMAVEHRALPVAAVQFHPESILSLEDGTGFRLIENVVRQLRPAMAEPAAVT